MNTRDNKKSNHPYIVELLGPSGAGKTTIFNKLIHTLGDDWKYNLIYNVVEEPFRNKYKSIENIYKLLFEKKVIDFIKNQSLYQMPRLANHFAIRVQRDLWMINRECEADRYINDEGLFHYYMHDILTLMQDNKITQEDLYIIVENRLVFNLIQTKENILRNLNARAIEFPGAPNDHIGKYSISEIEQEILSYLDTSSRILQKVKDVGGQVVDVDLDRPINMVIEDIKSYL